MFKQIQLTEHVVFQIILFINENFEIQKPILIKQIDLCYL